MKRVIVHIDSLVLKGFRPEDRHAVAEGLRRELGRLLATPEAAGLLAQRDDAGRLNLGAVRLAHATQPARVGEGAAQGIVRGITGGPRP